MVCIGREKVGFIGKGRDINGGRETGVRNASGSKGRNPLANCAGTCEPVLESVFSICNPEGGNQEFKVVNLEYFKFGRNRGEIRSDDLPIKEPGFLPTCSSTSVRILNLELHWVHICKPKGRNQESRLQRLGHAQDSRHCMRSRISIFCSWEDFTTVFPDLPASKATQHPRTDLTD